MAKKRAYRGRRGWLDYLWYLTDQLFTLARIVAICVAAYAVVGSFDIDANISRRKNSIISDVGEVVDGGMSVARAIRSWGGF